MNQSHYATIRTGKSPFSFVLTANHATIEDCRETATTMAKARLADTNGNPACLGCAEIVIFRQFKEKAFDNRIVANFVVLR